MTRQSLANGYEDRGGFVPPSEVGDSGVSIGAPSERAGSMGIKTHSRTTTAAKPVFGSAADVVDMLGLETVTGFGETSGFGRALIRDGMAGADEVEDGGFNSATDRYPEGTPGRGEELEDYPDEREGTPVTGAHPAGYHGRDAVSPARRTAHDEFTDTEQDDLDEDLLDFSDIGHAPNEYDDGPEWEDQVEGKVQAEQDMIPCDGCGLPVPAADEDRLCDACYAKSEGEPGPIGSRSRQAGEEKGGNPDDFAEHYDDPEADNKYGAAEPEPYGGPEIVPGMYLKSQETGHMLGVVDVQGDQVHMRNMDTGEDFPDSSMAEVQELMEMGYTIARRKPRQASRRPRPQETIEPVDEQSGFGGYR